MPETGRSNLIDYEVTGDGRTVWVNSSICIGRFGVNGIDIHREPGEQREKGECLFCTHKKTTREDWDTFVEKMKEFYGVVVLPRFMPERFRHEAAFGQGGF